MLRWMRRKQTNGLKSMQIHLFLILIQRTVTQSFISYTQSSTLWLPGLSKHTTHTNTFHNEFLENPDMLWNCDWGCWANSQLWRIFDSLQCCVYMAHSARSEGWGFSDFHFNSFRCFIHFFYCSHLFSCLEKEKKKIMQKFEIILFMFEQKQKKSSRGWIELRVEMNVFVQQRLKYPFSVCTTPCQIFKIMRLSDCSLESPLLCCLHQLPMAFPRTTQPFHCLDGDVYWNETHNSNWHCDGASNHSW